MAADSFATPSKDQAASAVSKIIVTSIEHRLVRIEKSSSIGGFETMLSKDDVHTALTEWRKGKKNPARHVKYEIVAQKGKKILYGILSKGKR